MTVGPSGSATNFLTARSYNLSVQVTYVQLGLTDTAAVTVWIREINKPATWTGLYNASTGAPMPIIAVSETTPFSTAIGRALFADPNTAFPWNARVYSLVGGAYGSGFFAIDATSGVISLAPPGGLSYWDSPTYTITVACTDSDPVAPLTTTQVITVSLIQVNTVSVASFDVPTVTLATAGVNVTGGSVQVATAGGTTVEIIGANFGPTARRLAENPAAAVSVTATYGPAAQPTLFAASACAVYSPNYVIRCTTVPGVGANLAWTVTVAGTWSATSSTLTAYFAPNITAVNKWDASQGTYAASNLLSTEGAEYVAIDGQNLSPYAALDIVWQYWSAASPAAVYTGPCSMGAPSTRVICTTAAGVGAQLRFQVRSEERGQAQGAS